MNFETLLTNSEHDLSLYTVAEIESFRQRTYDKDVKGKTRQFVHCLIRDKEIQLKPEEIVRQLYLEKLTGEYGCPKTLVKVEFLESFDVGKVFKTKAKCGEIFGKVIYNLIYKTNERI